MSDDKLLNNIHLADIPFPDVIENINYEQLLQGWKDEYKKRYPEFTADLESEPVIKLLEVAAYKEMMIRQRINEAAEANFLARAKGADLDNVAYRLPCPVQRLVLAEGDETASPPISPILESDEALRYRAWLAMEGLSVAGPYGSWLFHAHSCDARVKHVSAYSPQPAHQVITILSSEGNGMVTEELLAKVEQALNARDVRPGSDRLVVQSANIVEYSQNLTLLIPAGAGAKLIKSEAEKRLNAYVKSCHVIGHNVTVAGIHAAVMLSDVIDCHGAVAIEVDKYSAAYCTGFNVEIQVKA